MNPLPIPKDSQDWHGLALTARQKKAREISQSRLYGPRNSPLATNYSISDLWADFPACRREWKAVLREDEVPRSHPAYEHPTKDDKRVGIQRKTGQAIEEVENSVEMQ